jgi:TolB protein
MLLIVSLALLATAVAAVPAGAVMRGANGRISIARFDPDGSEQLWVADSYEHGGRGRARGDAGGTSAIFVVRVDGTGLRQLTPWGVQANDADWAPDGTRLVFQSENHHNGNNADLYVVNADGSDLTRITHNPPTAAFGDGTEPTRELSTDPAWSPDGSGSCSSR